MQTVFTEYPALFGTDDILYHIGKNLEIIANKPDNQIIPYSIVDNNNYGGSLIRNSALEIGIADGWTGNFTLGEIYKGLKSFNVTGLLSSPIFPFNKEKILKISCYVKPITGSARIFFYSFDAEGNVVLKTNGGLSTFLDPQNLVVGQWNKVVLYFSGVGTLSNNFAESSHLQCFLSSVNGTSNIIYNRVIVEETSLSEPVPYTLPYLPTGQIVYDPANNSVGRYNGTTVNWFM